ncbi:hypothetical protein MB02_06220 [Croceicoccus estronivorus]|uniref:hypothetical protein n=1 Tax=Croceicoccus estronivorus TaxID=1172626 RepID=UPI00083671B8|nr:hypothetical protein [Croceicoccus estronivorus]OCC25026.1 hypothetical protein MB02_06220 [Croceicoccus estronivorus]
MPIPSECVFKSRRIDTLVSSLASDGCDLRAPSDAMALDGELSLWIGAIGPIDVAVAHRHDDVLHVRFRQPLDPRIIAHFNAA